MKTVGKNKALTRCDTIGFGNLRLHQQPEDFCYGIDAVLLADFVAKGGVADHRNSLKDKKAIDLGCGTGIIPLILSYKTDLQDIWGLELQHQNYQLALDNIRMNGLKNRIHMINEDIARLRSGGYNQLANTFDIVCSNPPYIAPKSGIPNKNAFKFLARHETSGTLEDFVRGATFLLKDKGDFYLVHRPHRMVDIFSLCRTHKLEPKGIRLVAPREGEAPNIVLVHCVKNANPELKIMRPLYVYQQEEYTKEINQIYERV